MNTDKFLTIIIIFVGNRDKRQRCLENDRTKTKIEMKSFSLRLFSLEYFFRIFFSWSFLTHGKVKFNPSVFSLFAHFLARGIDQTSKNPKLFLHFRYAKTNIRFHVFISSKIKFCCRKMFAHCIRSAGEWRLDVWIMSIIYKLLSIKCAPHSLQTKWNASNSLCAWTCMHCKYLFIKILFQLCFVLTHPCNTYVRCS